MDPIFSAFGVPATVTRPDPNDTPVATTIVWGSWLTEDALGGSQVQRREPKRVLSVRLDQVPTLPRGSVIEAAEVAGGTSKRWRVDGLERLETDLGRYVVVHDPEPFSAEPEL